MLKTKTIVLYVQIFRNKKNSKNKKCIDCVCVIDSTS